MLKRKICEELKNEPKRTDNRNVAPLYSSYMFLVSVASAKCMMTVGDGQLVHMYEYEYLPVKRQLVVLLHKDVERAVIRVPGVAPLLLPPYRRPI